MLANHPKGNSAVATPKHLAEMAAYSVAMPVTVGLCLWILLGPLHIDQHLGAPLRKPMPEISRAALVAPVPPAQADSGPAVPETLTIGAVPAAETDSAVVLFPGDDGRLLVQMQGALARKGYSVGAAGADGNDDTVAALEAFQSNNALPVQPKCDPQCRTALGLPDPQ
jgi:Putative peptidoglycan binding domain